jgi:hypothetical protein
LISTRTTPPAHTRPQTRELCPLVPVCRLAVGTQDKHSVRYTTLLSARQGAARLGAVPGPSCAAGLAIDTKQPVHVRDLANGCVRYMCLLSP